MKKEQLKEILNTVKRLAKDSGSVIMEIYDSRDISLVRKTDERNSELTKADLMSNQIIVDGLRKNFPEIHILTEEEKDDKSRLEKESLWIIDPLDGTREFISRNGEFTVNIGLVDNGVSVLGVIYIPAKDELFYAAKGLGAYYVKNDKEEKISVSSKDNIADMTLMKSRSFSTEKEKILVEENDFVDVITSGSSLKGCRVAQGKADVYVRFGPQNEWDICAMNAILTEAGGILTEMDGKPRVYNQDDTLIYGFIVSNNQIHKIFIEIANDINKKIEIKEAKK